MLDIEVLGILTTKCNTIEPGEHMTVIREKVEDKSQANTNSKDYVVVNNKYKMDYFMAEPENMQLSGKLLNSQRHSMINSIMFLQALDLLRNILITGQRRSQPIPSTTGMCGIYTKKAIQRWTRQASKQQIIVPRCVDEILELWNSHIFGTQAQWKRKTMPSCSKT